MDYFEISSISSSHPPRPSGAIAPNTVNQDQTTVLRESAKALEATFLAEMLKHTGLGAMRESFNGGPGEAAFADHIATEYAKAIAKDGRIGLSEHIFRSLSSKMEAEQP